MAVGPSIERFAPPEAELTHALYEEYAPQIFRYCLHQLGSREEAEDAVQSTFLNAFRGIKRGVVPELESAWLFKIAHNVCLSRRRSTWRRGRVESPADFELVEELAPAPSRRSDELIGLQDVLEQMPEQQRRAILLREWQGLSYREIAEELELSQAAVETLIFRARRALAQGLEQPPAPARRKRLAGGDFANLVSSAQSILVGGGAAVKVAATVAVVSAGTVVATAPAQQHAARHPKAPAPKAVSHRPAQSAPVRIAPVTVARTAPTGVRRQVAAPHRHVVAQHAPVPVVDAPAPAVTPEPAPASATPPPAVAPVQPEPQQPAAQPETPAANRGNGNGNGNGASQSDSHGNGHGAPPSDKGSSGKTPPSIGHAVQGDGTPVVPPGLAKKQDDAVVQPAATAPAPATSDSAATQPAQKVQPESHGGPAAVSGDG